MDADGQVNRMKRECVAWRTAHASPPFPERRFEGESISQILNNPGTGAQAHSAD